VWQTPAVMIVAAKETGIVQLDKNMILDLLRERGQQDQASQAEQELPDQVDTDQHANLLQKFGLDPQELIQKFMGGGGLPKF
jgi:DNA-binding protein H-NS